MSTTTKIEWTNIHVARFWANVEKTEACWNWTGGTFGGRYGQFRVGAKKIKAHRFSWMLYGHDIPDGLILCHRCDNVRCVNPAHIFLGTHADNAHDRDAKGRTARGHAPRLPGETNPSAILKLSDVEIIRGLIQGGMRRVDIATQYGVSKSTIHAIAQGRTWQTPRHP